MFFRTNLFDPETLFFRIDSDDLRLRVNRPGKAALQINNAKNEYECDDVPCQMSFSGKRMNDLG